MTEEIKSKFKLHSRNQCKTCGALYCAIHESGSVKRAVATIVPPQGATLWMGKR